MAFTVKSKRLRRGLFAAIVFLLVLSGAANAANTYTSTAHGNSTSGVDRNAIGANSDPTMSVYGKGNCAHCHEQHASIEGAEPTPPAAEGATKHMLFRSNFGATDRNQLCFHCHEQLTVSSTATGYGRYDVYRGQTTYDDSAHDDSAGFIWPDSAAGGAPRENDAGNCLNCHNPHGHDDGSGVISSMLFKREENLCLECHDGNPAADNISAKVGVGQSYKHNVSGYSGLHAAGETLANISASKHVECGDCHNPHAAGSTKHTAGTTGNAVSDVLKNVAGASATFGTPDWSTGTGTTYSRTDSATKEYEICFKCHAKANTNYASWGGAGAAAWTDVGLEFNTNNAAYHPVAGPLSSPLDAAQLTGPWSPGGTMYCSDCHGFETSAGGAEGPHGSNVKWMLTGSNTAWPYTSSSYNGTSSGGTFFYLNGTTTDLFCLNCHPSPTSASSNSVHRKDDHWSSTYGRCVSCHIRVPHGGKVSRLIAADNSGSGLPSRYYPDGNGGGTRYLQRYRKTSKDSYAKNNCKASCAGDHNSNISPYESW